MGPPQSSDDRRGAPLDRRVSDLEEKYSTIIRRLDTIDHTLSDQNVVIGELTTLKDQVQGVLNFLRYVGWAGIVTMGAFVLRYVVKDFAR